MPRFPRCEVVSLVAMFSRTRFASNPLIMTYATCAVGSILAVVCGGGSQARILAQLVVLPVVLFGLSRLIISSVRLPKVIIGIAALAALSGAVLQYSNMGVSPGALVVARMKDDPLGSETVIIRDKLRKAYGPGGATQIVTQEKVVSSAEQAREFLMSQQNAGALVWGGERWLNLSMRVPEPFSLSRLPQGSVGQQLLNRRKIQDVFLIVGVPWVGVSSGANSTTAEFVTGMLGPIGQFSEIVRSSREDIEFDRAVRSVAALRTRWSSNAHRALPVWMSGTYHLSQALAASTLEGGDLLCALASFKSARANLRAGDNPTLEAALLNNQAIALMAYAEVSLDLKAHRTAARSLLLSARSLQNASGSFASCNQVWSAIESNIVAFHFDRPRR